MSISNHVVSSYSRRYEHRHVSTGLQQHDSATTLDLPLSMEGTKSEIAGPDVKRLDQQTLRDFGVAAKRAGSTTSGFASRETSPERGSIASYRMSSRPGTAQTYSTAELKRLYAGEPQSPRKKHMSCS